MGKNMKYTSDNLSEIQRTRKRITERIEDMNVQIRILKGQIVELTEIGSSLDKHIEAIIKENEKEDETENA